MSQQVGDATKAALGLALERSEPAMRDGFACLSHPEVGAADQPPFHLPGAVQSHGALLVITEPELEVVQASANLAAIIGLEPDRVLGRRLPELVPGATAAAIRKALDQAPFEGQNLDALRLPSGAFPGSASGPMAVLIHRHDGCTLVEIEPEPAADDPFQPASPQALEDALTVELVAQPGLIEVARLTAAAIAQVSRYSRVLVLRFAPDRSSDVIAEIRLPGSRPFLGQRLPASLLPPQVHDLYRARLLRMVSDVEAPPVPLVPPLNPLTAKPLDLGRATLRALTPDYHNLLQTMGVRSTLMASLIIDGQLWGLVCCLGDAPYRPSVATRATIAALSQTAGDAITHLCRRAQQEAERQVALRLAALERALVESRDAVHTLMAGDPGLPDLAAADGWALVVGSMVISAGHAPPPALIPPLVQRAARLERHLLVCDDLPALDAAFALTMASAAGALVVALTAEPLVGVVAFRSASRNQPGTFDEPSTEPAVGGGRCREWEPEALVAWRLLPVWLTSALGGSIGVLVRRLSTDLIALDPTDQLRQGSLWPLIAPGCGALVLQQRQGESELQVLASNRALRQLFCRAPADLIGLPLADALTLLGLPGDELCRLPPGTVRELSLTLPGQGSRLVRLSHRPLLQLWRQGRRENLIAWAIEDVTRQRRTEAALGSARDQAQIASRAKARFLAAMSHQLRTPLNVIIGFSEIMRAELFGPLGSVKYHEYSRHIQTSGGQLLGVIDNILDLSKVEAGHYVLEEQTLDLEALLNELCQQEAALASRSGVRLLVESDGRQLHLQGDGRALRQTVLNLLTSAFRFTPAGGTVICRLRLQDSGALAIEVQDTGTGIPEDYLSRVLDPFFKLGKLVSEPHQSDAGPGLGLGSGATSGPGVNPPELAVVRVLTTLHGGSLSVTPLPARGTSLQVTFPPWRSLGHDGNTLRPLEAE